MVMVAATAAAFAQGVEHLTTSSTSLIIKAPAGGAAEIVYYGARVSDAEAAWLGQQSTPMSAYPAWGMNCTAEVALSVTQADGNPSLELCVDNVTSSDQTITVVLKDKIYPLSVELCFQAYPDEDIIEVNSRITNLGKKPVTLYRFDSSVMPIRRPAQLVSLSGTWASEAEVTIEPLTPGIRAIINKDGARNAHTAHSEVMFSLDGAPQENTGAVIGAALCYSGNYELRVHTDDTDFHKFFAGINPDNSHYILAAKETFETPIVAYTYSNEGMSGVSRHFHDWARSRRLAHGSTERKILLNSWEGVYFRINEQGMENMMEDIASMGGELFVMDDGWFGDKYHRYNDSRALGDWVVDTNKLPNGIGHLVKTASEKGISFGIWIEPEMTNTISELYEKHPDWVLKAPGRDVVTGRGGTQLVLDLGNPAVQDFVVKVVDDIMSENPEIDYIKWDANAPISAAGSQYLPSDKQSHVYIEYHRGLVKACERIRAKYPDLTIQLCASGGGRANYGLLPYFDEFWVSDNTDALQRVYMQWGTSYFFPAIAMASHISAAPNHQTFRTTPLKYRIDVAMSGRLGMEIQPQNMTDEEKALCRKAIEQYKQIRPTVQFGDIYRLISPYEGLNVASLMYVAKDKAEAVFYWYKLEHFKNIHLPRVKLAGLDPQKLYRIEELNCIDIEPLPFEGQTFSGAYLMDVGLEIPVSHKVHYHEQNDWSTRVLRLVVL